MNVTSVGTYTHTQSILFNCCTVLTNMAFCNIITCLASGMIEAKSFPSYARPSFKYLKTAIHFPQSSFLKAKYCMSFLKGLSFQSFSYPCCSPLNCGVQMRPEQSAEQRGTSTSWDNSTGIYCNLGEEQIGIQGGPDLGPQARSTHPPYQEMHKVVYSKQI